MLRLHTFGSTFVADDAGAPLAGTATQRRGLALLAVLAVAGDRGMSRDKLLGLLWPETDLERARHSLTQALYAARRALRCEELFLAGPDVRLSAEHLTSDVRELEQALDAGELERAVAMYGGPFLDGFFLSGSPEFEQWAAAERQRLQARVGDALDRLATRAVGAGDARGVLEWRRRLAALQPLDAGSAAKLMTALASVGDRAGALQHARVHATLLREQLDLDPDPVVEALAAKLRDGADWALGAATTTAAAPIPVASAPPAPPAPRASPPALTGEVGVWIPTHRGPPTWWRWAAAALVLVVLVGLGVVLGRQLGPSGEEIRALATRQRVVVAPFRVAGADASLAYLREGMVELLSTRLADDSAARSVDAGAVLGAWRAAGLTTSTDVGRDTVVRLAERLGAERVVVGSVVGTRARVVLGATVLRVPDGTVGAQASVSGSADSITTLIDRLAARLLVSEAGQDESLAHYTSSSLPALQAFLAGQAAFREGEYAPALLHYERALRRDSSFALAALYKALTADRLNLEPALRAGVRVAWASRDNLNDRDLALLTALVGPRHPAVPTAPEQTAAWQRVVDLAPASADAWYAVAVRMLKDGAAAGLPSPAGQAMAALRRAIGASPAHEPARELLALLEGRPVPPADSGRATVVRRWRTALAAGDSGASRRLRAGLARLGTAELRAIATLSQYDDVGLDDGARAIAILQTRATSDADRADLVLAEHAVHLNRGRAADALAATLRLRRLQPGSDAWLRLRALDALYGGGDPAAGDTAAARLSAATAATPLDVPTSWDGWLANACVVGQWRLARGDTTGVGALVGVLRARRTVDPATRVSAAPLACAELLDAALAVAVRRRDAAAAVRRLDSLVFTLPSAGDAAAYAPIAVARLFERLGDVEGARRAIGKRVYLSGWPRYLAAARREEARLASRADARR